MAFNPARHHRRSIRLAGFDYTAPAAYFVTICTHERRHLFGEVTGGRMQLNAWGRIVLNRWHTLPHWFPRVRLDAFVVMPNHVHGIIVITAASPAGPPCPDGTRPDSLGAIVQYLKSASTRKINRVRRTPGAVVWQRGYYERILRNERERIACRRYVESNLARWTEDGDNLTA